MRVLRITRHPLQDLQRTGLKVAAQRLLGRDEDIEVIECAVTISSPEEVLEMVRKHGAEIVEAVLPINMLAPVLEALRKEGVPLIRAVMERKVANGEATFEWRGYEEIKAVKVETVELCRLDQLNA
ncbi:hypothetical protein [Thermoflexus sp.]|uniref:hypothetical protein n=1 Tax=Thermoflexus sp. TaxID=1969742 RepID=UPI002ADDE467|nr:hypothetical protein [Thermoflexus sp.]